MSPSVPTHPSPGRRRLAAALVAVLALPALAGAPPAPDPDAVSVDAARAEHAAGRAILIDLREPDEHARGVAPGARLLPTSQLPGRLSEIPADPSRPVLLVCHTQNRSRATLKALRERGGYAHVRYVAGGMSEWARRGLPLVKPGG